MTAPDSPSPVRPRAGRGRRRIAAALSLLLCLFIAASAGAARGHGGHRRPPSMTHAALLRVPTRPGPRSGLLDGRMLKLAGPTETHRSPLAMTRALIQKLKHGVVAGTMKTAADDGASRVAWSAGGVSLSSPPTSASLMPYNCLAADRLPGDPAATYRFTVFSVRF